MSDEETLNLETYLSKYSHIKKEGKSCPIEEARKFYVMALKSLQEETSSISCTIGINLSKNISYYLLSNDDTGMIVDDLHATKEIITAYEELLTTVKELYTNKKEYNAWVLEETFTTEVEEKEVDVVKKSYYVEKKEVKNKMREELYI